MSYDFKKLKEVFDNPEFSQLLEDEDWDTLINEGYFNNSKNELNLASFIIQKLHYPLLEEIGYIPEKCFYEDENIQGKFDIPDGVTEIGEHAFRRCINLTDIIIPNSVTEIGEHAFYLCENLTNITIPDSVTEIEEGVFWGCDSLPDIPIPNSVTEIGKSAFFDCKSLTNITIPNGVTEIGRCAFAGCESLSNITIPNSVTEIGNDAFYKCNNLKNVYYQGTKEEWDKIWVNKWQNVPLFNANIHFN